MGFGPTRQRPLTTLYASAEVSVTRSRTTNTYAIGGGSPCGSEAQKGHGEGDQTNSQYWTLGITPQMEVARQ